MTRGMYGGGGGGRAGSGEMAAKMGYEHPAGAVNGLEEEGAFLHAAASDLTHAAAAYAATMACSKGPVILLLLSLKQGR